MRVMTLKATVIIPSDFSIGKNEDGETALSPHARINSLTLVAHLNKTESVTGAAIKLRELAGAAVEAVLTAAAIAGATPAE